MKICTTCAKNEDCFSNVCDIMSIYPQGKTLTYLSKEVLITDSTIRLSSASLGSIAPYGFVLFTGTEYTMPNPPVPGSQPMGGCSLCSECLSRVTTSTYISTGGDNCQSTNYSSPCKKCNHQCVSICNPELVAYCGVTTETENGVTYPLLTNVIRGIDRDKCGRIPVAANFKHHNVNEIIIVNDADIMRNQYMCLMMEKIQLLLCKTGQCV